MPADIVIRPAVADDLPGIAAIYAHEIAHSIATFDLEPPTLAYWHEKLAGDHPGDHLLVAVDGDGDVVGYAYSWSYRPRPAYSLTRETSIYLDPSVRGRGIGRRLYPALLETMAASGVHTAVALVALPNPGSIRLHESMGFEQVGFMREVGFKFDQWIDVAWFQKMLGSEQVREAVLDMVAAAAEAGSEPVEPSGRIGLAVADLVARLGVDERSVVVVSDQDVTWPDASLGCPDPDTSYAQVLVHGSRTVLASDGKEFVYHAVDGGDPFLCSHPRPPVET